MNNEGRRCASCDIELDSDSPTAVTVGDISFCCSGCAQGGPCACTYEDDQARYPRDDHRDLMSVLALLEEGL